MVCLLPGSSDSNRFADNVLNYYIFQEDPFKLVILGKDPATIGATNANFFFGEGGDLSFVTTDERGVIRIYQYNPMGKYSTHEINASSD